MAAAASLLFAQAAGADAAAAQRALAPNAAEAPTQPDAGATLNAPPALLDSDLGRNLLRYIVECALPADAELTATVAGQALSFKGGLGLAPAWREAALTADDQRWVSACVLARSNYFGVKVPINLQGEHPLAALRTMDAASRAYAIDEGAFYGNLFQPQPVAYACVGKGPFSIKSRWLEKRICTRPRPGAGAITWCGFVATGQCADVCAAQDPVTGAYRDCTAPDGSVYRQVLTVHLRPD